MAANRLNRNQIVIAALDAVDSPSLDAKERPSGSLTGSLGIDFLQRALDFFYKQFPIKGVLTSTAATFTGGSEFVTLPADFLHDYLNGFIYTTPESQEVRVTRRALSYLLSQSTTHRGRPSHYAIVSDTQAMLRPVPDQNYSPTLWYYKLPTALGATDIPPFPDDQVLVDFLEIRYKEWLGAVPKGSALRYAREQVSELQKAGIGPEPEPDQIELDRNYYGEKGIDPWNSGWMGSTTL